jgi:hypothetical protein
MHTPRCQSCRYDMTGLPPVRCPECGGTAFIAGHPSPTTLQLTCWAMPVVTCVLIGVQVAATPVSLASGCDGYYGSLLSIALDDHSRPAKPVFKVASLVVICAPLIPSLLASWAPRVRSLTMSLVAMLLGQLGIVALCLRWEHGSGDVFSSAALPALGCGAMAALTVWCIGAVAPTLEHNGVHPATPHPAPAPPPIDRR